MESKEEVKTIIGRKPVLDALKSHAPISSIWIDRSLKGKEEIEIRQAAKEEAIPLKRVSKLVLDKKTNANHQGIIAYTSPVRYSDLENLIAHIYAIGEIPLLLYLDRIQDVGNFGSIVRTAEIMGAHAIVIPSQKMAPVNDQVVKISAGALFHMPLSRVINVKDTLQLMQRNGLQILASSLESENNITNVDLMGPLCIVIGSEDTGISREVEDTSDALFTIPQYGKTESLNAAVATGMILYEVQRQRNLPK